MENNQSPLLFIHGAWHGAWCWEEHFLPYFAQQGYRAYALDLRGHGRNTGRDNVRWLRARRYVEDIAEFASTLPAPPILIGHSLGGYIIQKYLEKYRVPAAVLLTPIPVRGIGRMLLRCTQHDPIGVTKMILRCSTFQLIRTPELARWAFFSEAYPDEALNQTYAQLQEESYATACDALIFDLPRPHKVAPIPILVVGAEKDRLFSNEEMQQTAQKYQADLKIMPGMPHHVLLESGWQQVADEVLAWLSRLPQPAPAIKAHG